MKLLIVEDDQTTLEMWGREVDDFNSDDEQKVTLDLQTTVNAKEALDLLATEHFDFLMVDLRLPKGNTAPEDASEGNALIQDIILKFPIVTAVHSGHPGELVKESLGDEVQVFTKAAQEPMVVLKWFAEQSDVAEALSKTFHGVQQILAELFHHSIWPRWKRKWSAELSPDIVKSIISRQSAAYIGEAITHQTAQSALHHPEEFYIAPPLRSRLHTGDLVKVNDELFVVLSPQCDMANVCYPDHILLSKCEGCTAENGNDEWKSFYSKRNHENDKRREEALRKLRSLLNQDINKSLHFLPPFDSDGPWLVNFKQILTIPASQVETLVANRVVSIAPSFIPNLVQRFSAYIGRIGQPDVCPDFTNKEVQRIIDASQK